MTAESRARGDAEDILLSADHYRRQLETVANNATVALFVMDEHQQCSYMNPAAELLTGYTLAEVLGRALHDVIHHTRPDGTPYPLSECPIDQAFPENNREQGEEVFVHKDGSFYPVAYTASPIREHGTPIGTIIEVRDISAEKHAEAELRERTHQAELLADIGRVLTGTDVIQMKLQRCAEAIVQHVDASLARVWIMDEETDILVLNASAGLHTHLDGPHGRIRLGEYKIGRIAQERRPHLTNQVVGDPHVHDQDWAAREGLVGFAGYPLIAEDRVVGVLAAFFRHPLSDASHATLASVSDSIAVAIGRAGAETARTQLLARLETHASQLRALADAALAIHADLSLDETIRITTESARRVVGSHQAITSMTISDDWAQAITAVETSDKYAAWQNYTTPPNGSGIYSLVCQTNQPMRLTQDELEAHPHWRGFGADATEHPPMRGWLAAPLIGRDGQNLGLIQLSDKEEGEFTESDEAILVQLAQLASVGIENARLYEETQAAVEARERFLALASHELKTPLTSIKGISQLVSRRLRQSPPDVDRAVDLVGQLEQQIRRLETLVSDLLDISRIQQGRLDLRLLPADLTEIARAVVQRFEPPHDTQSRWTLVLNAPQPVRGMWDPARVDQVLTNLVSNAIKYSPEGGTVTVSVTHVEGNAEARVSDQGIGIPPSEQATLFEPFVRGARASGVAGGDGLGLHISAQIVAQHGGTIAVESTPGEGSVFTVRLPITDAANERPL